MSDQFGRVCSLIVGDPTGQALDLSELHIRFSVSSANVQTPKTASIRVYNVSDDTARRIRSEFTQIILKAGYTGTADVIFSGQVRQIRTGRENGTDTFLDILAADGDIGYLNACVKKTLSKGWTPTDIRKECLDAMAPYGITAGQMADLPDIHGVRATSLYAPARDILRQLCDTFGMQWCITLGKLEMSPTDATLGGVAIELTSASGLIGVPQQTLDGIIVRCLINPQIRPGRQIKLNQKSVQEMPISTAAKYLDTRPKMDPDGSYKVWAASTSGDTRGNDWYMDLVCTGIDGTLPMTDAFKQIKGVYGS